MLASGFTGLIAGAVVTYLAGGCVYSLIYANEVIDSYSCARGTAVGFLLIFLGLDLGAMSGGIFGYANRIYKSSD